MRLRLVIALTLLVTSQAFAQKAGKFELQVATGTVLFRFSDEFSTTRYLSTSAIYDLTDNSGIVLSYHHLAYTFDKQFHDNTWFDAGGTPAIQRSLNMVLIGYRKLGPNASGIISSYGSASFGLAHSVTSPSGYYYGSVGNDSSYKTLGAGYTIVGLMSLGVQITPCSFMHVFADIEIPVPSNLDLFPGGITLRGGVGIPIFSR